MIVLNNVAVGDTYSDALTVVSLSIENLSLFVFNNAVTLQVFKRNPGGGQDYERLPEQNMAPGSAQFPGAVGIRIKNANPGSQARVILVAPEFDKNSPDPGMVGYVPTTLTLTAQGTVGQVGVIDRQTAALDIAGTNVETNVYSYGFAAGQLAANSIVRGRISGDYLFNNANTDGYTARMKLGGTTFWAATNANTALAVSAVRHEWWWEWEIVQVAINQQWIKCRLTAEQGQAVAPTTGQGMLDVIRAGSNFLPAFGGEGVAGTIDMSQAQTFALTWQWSVSTPNDSWRRRYAYTELL